MAHTRKQLELHYGYNQNLMLTSLGLGVTFLIAATQVSNDWFKIVFSTMALVLLAAAMLFGFMFVYCYSKLSKLR